MSDTKRDKPKYIMVYRCEVCGLESGYTELDLPLCRYCREETTMTLVKQQDLTPEAIAERLKVSADNMMRNMENAFHSMTEEDKELFGDDKDAEGEMLKLLARMQKFKEQIEQLKLKDLNEDLDNSP
jgi:ribosomal protein S14